MQLNHSQADLYVPDGISIEEALRRTTCMGIGAHQDDLEVFAFHGIIRCYDQNDEWFTGVTVTNGSGSARSGPYSSFSDEEMLEARRLEQRAAADLGKYSAQLQLGYDSSEIKSRESRSPIEDLKRILEAARPEVLYLHNPADKHETHIASLVKCVEAIRALDPGARPAKVYGCEVWRDLDWLSDEQKICLDVSGHEELAASLLEVFDTQIAGGKRYDLATLGRRRANATFYDSHQIDRSDSVTFAMDLSPLFDSDILSLEEFVESKIQDFRAEAINSLKRFENR